MATYDAARDYLRSTYKCRELENGNLNLTFDLGGGRSQVIIVTWSGPSRQEAVCLDLHSPIGDFGAVDLERAVRMTVDYSMGGISTFAGVVTLRNSLPLENLDRNEIETPLHVLLQVADKMEQLLVGGDTF